MNKQGREERFFWRERGEQIFLYIIISVLILAGLLFWLAHSARAQEKGQNILGFVGQKALISYDYLKEGTNRLKESLQEERKIEADRLVKKKKSQDKPKKIDLILPYPKKIQLREVSLDQIRDAVSYQIALDLAQASTNEQISAIIKIGKYIDIDISSQTLTIFQDGKSLGSYRVSTGSSSYPTPLGVFQVKSKSLNAYSTEYNLYMPYWMAFIGNSYGIHELPYYPNGYREGSNLLGQAVSHGCVRLGVGAAGRVYSWALIGTPVVVHN